MIAIITVNTKRGEHHKTLDPPTLQEAPASYPFTLWGSPWEGLVPEYSIYHLEEDQLVNQVLIEGKKFKMYTPVYVHLTQAGAAPPAPS